MSIKEKILVTGGVGYIGSHTVVELIQQGFEVYIIDNLSNSKIEVLDAIQKITGIKPHFTQLDLCDRNTVNQYFSMHKDIKAIVHFAAFKAVGESVAEPLKYYHNNIASLVNILEAAKNNNITNIVFSSSCTVYGQPEKLPVTEESPIIPAISPYGFTKQMGEVILRDYVSAHSTKVISLRYFNPIGAHESALIGEYPNGVPNNLVPFITQTAIGLRKQLTVHGNDYGTNDGSCIRDYINVVDLAKAHVVAIKRLIENRNKSNFEVFNIGTGQGTTVLEVITTFEKISGTKLNYVIGPRRAGDVEKVYADTSLANKELGWKSEETLENTILSSWNWEKKINGKT